ncbi:hypothetical protein SPOG_03759 [Schizosaccharomyces cryophilus OY26]|uniref:Uncharacterized protein n=1 Tax=Schizosaccharomyces cryophilus (strain OY26 / ATCC MYA-4695 / CBS 11777 / NBRC 106824 / NRRL Y48691) TaxID=653667 RepID=S9XHR4_SCHCR|nr:uncharacterized protein SPOG_03759 [Schizosaccharomyces cryophilus OY26]EPY53221.1 hypothetical protein SPOG_03759 [Schizosaccharomyces cryophilus OY26]
MVLVEHFCIHRCQPNGSVQMLWMYHTPILGNQKNEHTNSVEINHDRELEPLKNQIALLHGMYGFSSETNDILREENNESYLEGSSENNSYILDLFGHYNCMSTETSLTRKILILRPSSDWVPSSRGRDDGSCISIEEIPSIFLTVTKPCPSPATLISTVIALWSQYQLFYGDKWMSQMNESDVYEAFDKWWTARLSPLECGGSILRAMNVIAVGRPLDREKIALFNDLFLSTEYFMGSMLVYVPSVVQPNLVYEQGQRLRPKIRNILIMYCMSECQNLLEGEEYSRSFGPYTFSDLHSSGSEYHDEGTRWKLCVNCVFKKRQKRIFLIRWSRDCGNTCEQNNYDNFMVRNAMNDDDDDDIELKKRLWEQVYEMQIKHELEHEHGGGVKRKTKEHDAIDDFWYIVIHHSTGLASVYTEFPIQDAQHIWIHVDDIWSNQKLNASRMTHSNRGYWIALRHQTLTRAKETLESESLGQDDLESENEEQGNLQKSAESLINQATTIQTCKEERLTYLLISKAKRWNSLNEMNGKILEIVSKVWTH